MSEDDNSSAGVGFIINKKEEKHVITTQDNSNHVAYIVIKLKWVLVKVIQAYEDEDVEKFYENINKARIKQKTQFTLIS